HSSSASRRGVVLPCSPRYPVLSRRTSSTVRPATTTSRADRGARSFRLFEEPPGLVLLCQRLDEQVEIAVEHALQLMQREVDAVVGHPGLRIVVRADLLAAVAAAHHGAPGLLELRLSLRLFLVVEAGAQHAHRLGAVLDLRLLVLARDHEPG